MKMKKTITLVGLLLCLSALSFARGIKTGDKAPDFTLKLSDGRTVSLSDYEGKAVLLHFWATWCPPCRAELPEMDKLAKQLDAQGNDSKLAFLAVCISDTEKSRASFMQKNQYTFTGGLDAQGKLANAYSVEAIPTSVLISPDGKIVKMHTGMMSKADLESFVKGYAD